MLNTCRKGGVGGAIKSSASKAEVIAGPTAASGAKPACGDRSVRCPADLAGSQLCHWRGLGRDRRGRDLLGARTGWSQVNGRRHAADAASGPGDTAGVPRARVCISFRCTLILRWPMTAMGREPKFACGWESDVRGQEPGGHVLLRALSRPPSTFPRSLDVL